MVQINNFKSLKFKIGAEKMCDNNKAKDGREVNGVEPF